MESKKCKGAFRSRAREIEGEPDVWLYFFLGFCFGILAAIIVLFIKG